MLPLFPAGLGDKKEDGGGIGPLRSQLTILLPAATEKTKNNHMSSQNIATGKTSQAITPYHFFKLKLFFT